MKCQKFLRPSSCQVVFFAEMLKTLPCALIVALHLCSNLFHAILCCDEGVTGEASSTSLQLLQEGVHLSQCCPPMAHHGTPGRDMQLDGSNATRGPYVHPDRMGSCSHLIMIQSSSFSHRFRLKRTLKMASILFAPIWNK